MTADGPGIGKISILFLIHSKTIKFPGSDTEGVPASVIIDTDLFFTHEDNRETYRRLLNVKPNVFFKTINSIHGHDAFLIEHDQLRNLLKEVFTPIHEHV